MTADRKFEDILAGGGSGIWFLASKDYGTDVGIDGAVTKDGNAAAAPMRITADIAMGHLLQGPQHPGG